MRKRYPKYNYKGVVSFSHPTPFPGSIAGERTDAAGFNGRDTRPVSFTAFMYGYKNKTMATRAFVARHLKTLRANGLRGTRKEVVASLELTRTGMYVKPSKPTRTR